MSSKALSLTLYNLALPLGLVLMLPGAFIKMRRRNGRWRDLGQRIGMFSSETRAAINALPARERFWVHAVSVGEVGVAKKLIARLLKTHGELGIVLSTTTPTGYALAAELAAQHAGRVVAIYSPIDLPGVGRLMLERIQPTQLVLVEAEVWPNLTASASRLGIPVSLVNARLSPRSARRYLKFSWLVGPIFRMLKQVLVQEEEDVARWQGFGVDAERIHFTGSIKYDPEGACVPAGKIDELRTVLTRPALPRRSPRCWPPAHMRAKKSSWPVSSCACGSRCVILRCSSCRVMSSAVRRSALRCKASASPLPCAAIRLHA
jgi:3-deoxy-D-manno-octulosonic-acid transferase